MAKHVSRSSRIQAVPDQTVSVQLALPMFGALSNARSSFHDLCVETGQQVLQAMMEQDREALCGPTGRHDAERGAWRGGTTASRVTLGGRQVELRRPRARSGEGEVQLPSFEWASSRDALNERTLEAITAGVSTRKYRRSLEPLPAGTAEHASGRSAVSRRFVALSRQRLNEFLSRPLGELDIRVVFIDGKVFHDHCMLVALGVDCEGRKHVVGLREGSTENARVARALLSDLVDRGLSSERTTLFIIDGAKALRKAIRTTYGELGIVQRCQFHKLRNVLGHLPEEAKPSVKRTLQDAWSAGSAKLGKRQLERLANSLKHTHPGAAESIREGLDETLTVLELGLDGALTRILRTTNIIENLNSSIEHYTRNVRRWRGGEMVQRWVCAAVLEAEKKFRRVQGYKDMNKLFIALDNATPASTNPSKVA